MFVGIDVGQDALHCAALDRGGALAKARIFAADELAALGEWVAGARVVAIDAPAQVSTAPHEDDDSLKPKFCSARCAEIALGRKHGYWVPWAAPTARPTTGWMATGFALYDEVAKRALPMVIEVFPDAGFRELNGGPRPAKKRTAAGIQARAELLRKAGVAVEHLEMWSHDALDAMLAAVVALQADSNVAVRVGCRHDDSAIWLPRATG